jgi:hypothetical protein
MSLLAEPGRWPWFSLGLVVAAAAAASLPGFGASLAWQPGADLWRLATCQLTHWDPDHLRWDAMAVGIQGCWAEMRWPSAARWTLALGLVAIPIIIALVHHNLAYRGLSGLACALAAMGAVRAARDARHTSDGPAFLVAVTLLAGLLAKTAWELVTGDALFAAADTWIPLPAAHVAGIDIGLITGLASGHDVRNPSPTPRTTHA